MQAFRRCHPSVAAPACSVHARAWRIHEGAYGHAEARPCGARPTALLLLLLRRRLCGYVLGQAQRNAHLRSGGSHARTSIGRRMRHASDGRAFKVRASSLAHMVGAHVHVANEREVVQPWSTDICAADQSMQTGFKHGAISAGSVMPSSLPQPCLPCVLPPVCSGAAYAVFHTSSSPHMPLHQCLGHMHVPLHQCSGHMHKPILHSF